MRLPEDMEEHQKLSPTVVSSIVAVTLFVSAILIVVLIVNNKPKTVQQSNVETSKADTLQTNSVDEQYPDTEDLLSGSKLTPDDLDFWDKYPVESTEEASKEEEKQQELENDPSKDGKHTLVEMADGSEEWVLISPYLPKHEYDFTKLVCQSNIMKYYVDGKQVSFVGVDISKFQDYVDFVKLKKAGIDYVMLRVGFRGYSSGQLVLDDYFLDNIKRATDAGLEVGVYFFSQAITEDEAKEEANMVLEYVKEYSITYPMAFQMEGIDNDVARIDNLSKTEKTTIAKAFLDTIQGAGYKPILYGDKEWLIKQIDMSKLTAYDVWLNQNKDIPDYPYRFTMWKYYKDAVVDGIAGYVDLNISFINYTEK